MAGRYFYHRATGQLKIIYAFETAEGYEGNQQWREWQRPELPAYTPPQPYIAPPGRTGPPPQMEPKPEPELAPVTAKVPVRDLSVYVAKTRRERRTLLMTHEATIQQNMLDIVDQRFTRWFRETFPYDEYVMEDCPLGSPVWTDLALDRCDRV